MVPKLQKKLYIEEKFLWTDQNVNSGTIEIRKKSEPLQVQT
jgi:hypothetical protein